MTRTARISTTARTIADDCANDVRSYDGSPITGLTLGTAFGNTLAMVATLAKMVAELADEIGSMRLVLDARTEGQS